MTQQKTFFIFGAGFSGKAFGALASAAGATVFGTTRSEQKKAELAAHNIHPVLFDGSEVTTDLQDAMHQATDLIISIAPDEQGDPVLRNASKLIANAPKLGWIAYLSTVGVYGNHDGRWVDETTACRPVSQRSIQRMAAEEAWTDFARKNNLPLAILRLSGIYGPGRNALKNMVEGKARRLIKPGQVFNRIHATDIARSLLFLSQQSADGIFNVTDDMPSPPQDVVEHAALVTKIDAPKPIDFDSATLSPMARSFYGENKRVSNAKLKSTGFQFTYPDYRQALDKMWSDDNWR